MLELLNRMRINPQAELGLLTRSLGTPARSNDANIDSALRFFNVNGSILASDWSQLVAAQPLAWNDKLYAAAEGHSQKQIDFDQQSHQLPGEPDLGDRATNAGYTNWSRVGENVYAFSDTVLYGHAGFAIDWGNDTGGLQDPAGHRENMMDNAYTEVGIRILSSPVTPSRDTGPLVITQDFGDRYTSSNPFLVGVVYADSNADGYSPGEGFGNVNITAVSNNGGAGGITYTTASMSAGGWQLRVPQGTYRVSFSGAGFSSQTYQTIVVGTDNVKLDAVQGVTPPVPQAKMYGHGVFITDGDTTPNRTDFTDLGNVNLTFQTVTQTFTLTNAGNLRLNLTSVPKINITGVAANDFFVSSNLPNFIEPGQSASFSISFDPSVIGLRTATVTIATDDPNTLNYHFRIQGHGIKRPIIAVSGNQTGIANGDTTPTTADWTNFAGINAQYGNKVRIFTLTNVGLKTLNLTDVTLAGANANLFNIFAQPNDTSLEPGQSAQFRVRFTPNSTAGFCYATLVVHSDDPTTTTYAFDIRGTGLAQPLIQVFGGAPPVMIANGDSTPSLSDKSDFGQVSVSNQNRLRLFTIRNTGLANLNLSGMSFVTISGSNASDFTLSQPISIGTLLPGQSTTFKVKFDPSASGERDALLTISSDDPLNGLFEFSLAGMGV